MGGTVPHYGKLQQDGEATRIGRDQFPTGGRVLMENMDRDIYEILRQREIELVRVRQEVDALKIVIPLVEEDESLHAVR
jgi:hypothetical protein